MRGRVRGREPIEVGSRARSRPPRSRARTSSSGSSPGPATRSRSRTVTLSSTGSRRPTSPTSTPAATPAPATSRADHHSTRPLLHDGRQPWSQRRQPLLGPRPRRLDHRRGLCHLLAARPDRRSSKGSRPTGAGWPAAAASSPSTAGCGSRFVAGADEAGRGCLAGPLVAAAVLIDYERLSHADRRALGGLHDSKQMTEERRLEMFPAVLRAAERVSVVIRSAAGIDRRGLHVTNIEALSAALERLSPGEQATCLVDGFRLPRCAVPHRAVVQGDATSAAIAAASVLAEGDARPLHARGGARRIPAGGSRSTSATRPPSTARRSRRSGSRRCTGAPSSRSPTPSSSWPEGALSEGAFDVLEVDRAAAPVEGDADGVEADLRRSGGRSRRAAIQAVARRRIRSCLRRSTARIGRSGPKAAPARPALTSTKTRARPSRATMSSSPWRVRALRSRISQPAARRRRATRSSASRPVLRRRSVISGVQGRGT